jgi:hypothetical protein
MARVPYARAFTLLLSNWHAWPTVNGNVGLTAPIWCFAFGQRVLQQLPIGIIVL